MFSEKDFPNDANIQKNLFYPKENDKGMKGTKEKAESDNRNIIGLLKFLSNVNPFMLKTKTAEPRRVSKVDKRPLIWEAAKHTSNGNRNRSN
ncbi:MAG: hypothetical protein IK017_01405 [Paludibacteraceae bacterium]|nr:hypothetical protein [Paludibacteraceae bacterium]